MWPPGAFIEEQEGRSGLILMNFLKTLQVEKINKVAKVFVVDAVRSSGFCIRAETIELSTY